MKRKCCENLFEMERFLILLFIGIVHGNTRNSVVEREFCLQEGFGASCNNDAIIIMESADYGRMHMGRCVTSDYGFIGCGTDVLDVMSDACSGLQTCHIGNLEGLFQGPFRCPADLKPFLEASWKCEKVVTGDHRSCDYGYVTASPPHGFLSSTTTVSENVGMTGCPWLIKGQPGQRINITLLDFRNNHALGTVRWDSGPRYCREYAVLREPTVVRALVVCDGDPPVKRTYISNSHVLEVEMDISDNEDTTHRYLLSYNVIGCPLPIIPKNVKHKLNDDGSLQIRCNGTNTWRTIQCVSGKWSGNIGNCSALLMQTGGGSSHIFPLGVTILLILGIALLICTLTLVIGLLHFRRKHKQKRNHEIVYGTIRERDDGLKPDATDQRKHSTPTLAMDDYNRARFATIERSHYAPATRIRQPTGGEYSHIWEVQRPLPPIIPNNKDNENETNSTKVNPSTRDDAAVDLLPAQRPPAPTFLPPADDHIYQSPNFQRPGTCSREHPFYFELDPNARGKKKKVPTATLR